MPASARPPILFHYHLVTAYASSILGFHPPSRTPSEARCDHYYGGYVNWCAEQGEKPLTNQHFGRMISTQLGLERKRARQNGERAYVYVLDKEVVGARAASL